MQPSQLHTLTHVSGSRAVFAAHGAQLLAWQPAGAPEQLYRSPVSQPAAGRAVRGGVPVCFPQFAERGPLVKHGFARNVVWRVEAAPGELRFHLDDGITPGAWGERYAVQLVPQLGPDWIDLELRVRNPGTKAWSFTAALHTYVAVSDARAARLHGLQGVQFEDKVRAGAVFRQEEGALALGGELDRVYLAPPAVLRLERPGTGGLVVRQRGFLDTVVWNPGPALAARLGDMPPEDWRRMVCVEAAAVGQAVEVAPGGEWVGAQRLELR